MRPYIPYLLLPAFAVVAACAAGCAAPNAPMPAEAGGRFDSDLAFLREHTHAQAVVLTDPSTGARVAVAPGYQGRVMTSTTGGRDSQSFGWIGRAAISSNERQPHINVFGGEDRFWLGPEGGQYSLFFKAGDPFDLDHWQTPEPFDWGSWDVSEQSGTAIRFRKHMALVNYSKAPIDVDVDRVVRLLTPADVRTHLGKAPRAGVRMVAFESSNTVTNAGSMAWQPKSGLVSIWILGMFNPSRSTTIAVPVVAGPESGLGPVVNDKYFGKVPPDRLRATDSMIFFRGDGQYRSKIGLSPERARSLAGSYDAEGRVLTLVQYTRPDEPRPYVNSMWEIQREPYKGDVINSYNDGPPAPGKPPLGPFYELETSSPALSLAPGESYTHVHRTLHFVGPEADLDALSREVLHIGIAELSNAFQP